MISQKYETAVFNINKLIRQISWAADEHIRMISERLCDTED